MHSKCNYVKRDGAIYNQIDQFADNFFKNDDMISYCIPLRIKTTDVSYYECDNM